MGDSMDDLDDMLPANCPSPYFDTWDRHNSIAFSATKGLRNAPGENNCFVNCAVQVFWHLDVFRRSYRRLLGHTCMGNSCIFCALKVIFTQFQYSDKSSLHPDALRKALAETFANQQRFQLGHMDDAAECFENILRRIHFHIACSQNEDSCNAPHCLPHQKFSMAVYEKVVCPCGASSSPLKFSEMVHYVSASALVAQSRIMQENGDALHPDRFGLLLRKASAMGDVRNCPANCGKQVQKQRTLLNIPDVVSVGLVWDSDHPNVETTTEVAGALGTAILLQDMYHRVMPDVRKLPRLQLVAVVCYYGKHYSTFVFHSKLKTWVYFDDATVREIGPQWENVVDKCSRGRFQPLLLLYANPSAVPVSTDTAPRKRVMAPGYAPEDSDSGLDRTQESIKSMASSAKRSITPNPDHQLSASPSQPTPSQAPAQEHSPQDAGRDSPARLTREHSRQPSFLFAVTGKVDKNKQNESNGEVGGQLVGGTSHHHHHPPASRRQLLDGGANAGRLETMAEDAGDYADYTLSSGNQYRRPSLNGADASNQLPMPPNLARYPDTQRKDSFTKRPPGREKAGVDVVRYQADANRATNRTPDYSLQQAHADGAFSPPQKAVDKVGHRKPPVHHRSLSSSRDEEPADLSSQHVVVKPKPTGHGNYDTTDGTLHTPVQSGLATLPRHKGQNHNSGENPSHQRQSSTHQEVAHLTRKTNAQCKAVDPPLPPGTPPPEYNMVTDPLPPHSRQTSASSQASSMKSSLSMGHIDQASAGKKADSDKAKKKVKKEKKAEKETGKKSTDKKKSKSDSALKKSESESDLTADKSKSYIDRRMVESILKHQGVHRQNSSCSNNSVSSVESDSLMGKLLASKSANGGLTVDIPYDNVSIGSQKDSGYGSSDRNSSSSTGSGTVDPYTQYFISKSMVVPRTVNTQHLVEHQHCQSSKGPSDPYSNRPPHPSHNNGIREDGRKIMHPIKESSQEDMLKLSSPNEPIGTQKFILAPAAVSDARPPPVPPKNFAQFQIIKSSQSGHERESSLDSLDKDETISDRFVSLCKKADVLMDNCMLAETQEDMQSALYCCDGALGCLKEAMSQKDLHSKALAYVQKKHNSCLLKSRSLQKRSPASRQESHSSGIGSDITSSVGNRSSITSSDSDMSDHIIKQMRVDSKPAPPQHRTRSSQDSISSNRSVHERQNSSSRQQAADGFRQGQTLDNKNGYHDSIAPTGGARLGGQEGVANHLRTDSGNVVPFHQSHSAHYIHGGSASGGDGVGGSADLYGTLPRNKSRKPSSDAPASAEVYQSFLNKQKCLQAGVTSSQQSLDSIKSDSGSSDHSNPGSGQQKMSKSEIRQLLQDKFSQRQPGIAPAPHQQQQQSRQQAEARDPGPQSSMLQRPGQNYEAAGPRPQSVGGPPSTWQQASSAHKQHNPQQLPAHSVQRQQHPGYGHQQNFTTHPPQQQQQQQQQPPQQLSQHPNRPPLQQHSNYPQQHSAQQQQQSHQQYPQHPPQQQPPYAYAPPSQQHQQKQQQQTFSHSHSHQNHPAAAGYYHQQQPQPGSSQRYPQQPAGSGMSSQASGQQLGSRPSQAPAGTNKPLPPPVPGQKPSVPYPSAMVAPRAPANQGSAFPAPGPTPQPPHRPDSAEVGRRMSAQSLAPRATPGAGIPPLQPGNGGSYLVMMPPSPAPSLQAHQSMPPPSASSAAPFGVQIRHTASSQHLSGLASAGAPAASKPLERCASQPDCQKLVDNAYSANLSDERASSYNGVYRMISSPLPLAPSSKRHHTPEGSVDSNNSATGEPDSVPVSVRALASRFENTDMMEQLAGSRPCSRHGSLKSEGANHPQRAAGVQRTRSKSESFSRKPKSVLKNKKNKSRPRKSVTFAESIAHYANCEEANSGYESAKEMSSPRFTLDDRAYYSDDEERLGSSHVSYSDNDLDDVEDAGSSNSDDSPVGEDDACQLCNKRRNESGKLFCSKCSFYMGKLKSS